MLENQEEIRKRIINIRKERGLSQNQLAKDFGISRTHYCNVENGKKPVTESFLKVLASGYKIPIDTFIPNDNITHFEYGDSTNDYAWSIISDYLNLFYLRKYYINEGQFPYFALLTYLEDVDYFIEYEKISDPFIDEIFDPIAGAFDYVEMEESGVIHIYSPKTNKEISRIPVEKLLALDNEVRSFVDYKLSTFRPTKAKKRTIKNEETGRIFKYENEMKRLQKYKEYILKCIKDLEDLNNGGTI